MGPGGTEGVGEVRTRHVSCFVRRVLRTSIDRHGGNLKGKCRGGLVCEGSLLQVGEDERKVRCQHQRVQGVENKEIKKSVGGDNGLQRPVRDFNTGGRVHWGP